MRRYELREVTRNEIVQVTCDRCGDACMPDEELACRNDTSAHVEVTGCYGSEIPQDMTRWVFDLCEHCLGWLVSTFRAAPSTEYVDLYGNLREPIAPENDPVLRALRTRDLSGLTEHGLRAVRRAFAKVDAGAHWEDRLTPSERKLLWCSEHLYGGQAVKYLRPDAVAAYLARTGWTRVAETPETWARQPAPQVRSVSDGVTTYSEPDALVLHVRPDDVTCDYVEDRHDAYGVLHTIARAEHRSEVHVYAAILGDEGPWTAAPTGSTTS